MIPPVFSMADTQCNEQQSIPGILCNLVELKKFSSYSSIINMVDSVLWQVFLGDMSMTPMGDELFVQFRTKWISSWNSVVLLANFKASSSKSSRF